MSQPSVEVRFDELTAASMAPAGASDGLFTVGVDLKVKVFVRLRLPLLVVSLAAF